MAVGVAVAVAVGVAVGVEEGVPVGVAVAVAVGDGVGLGLTAGQFCRLLNSTSSRYQAPPGSAPGPNASVTRRKRTSTWKREKPPRLISPFLIGAVEPPPVQAARPAIALPKSGATVPLYPPETN